MAINLSDSIRVGQQKPIDDRYYNELQPYINEVEVCSLLSSALRYRGLTVNISGTEYWFKDGIEDEDLVLKEEGGGGGDKHFTYEQTTPSAIWSITHPLNKKVSVTVTDSAGTVMEGQVTLNTETQVEIQFNVPFWGYAYLN